MVRFLDRVLRYRNHHAEALPELAQVGVKVRVNERYGLLGIPLENGDVSLFCVADADEPWRPCSIAPPVRSVHDLVDRMEERGGFSLPGALLLGIDETGSRH